jgi:N-acetylglucosaminyldiphosphoundecaprenol N-acetyl-beta-D-mannosaminyltransferase
MRSKSNIVELLGFKISDTNYQSLLYEISNAIEAKTRLTIAYCNANTVRLSNNKPAIKKLFSSFNIVHPDGFGIWLASNILGSIKLSNRFNWTDCSFDFLIECEKNNWGVYFLGSDNETLTMMISELKAKLPLLNICGYQNGYQNIDDKIINQINNSNADILWVGLGTTKQEDWIYSNNSKLNCSVIQSVGDLFSFLSGSRWRGNKLLRNLGFEWLIRFVQHPKKYFNRYVIGIPVFIYLIVKEYFRLKL